MLSIRPALAQMHSVPAGRDLSPNRYLRASRRACRSSRASAGSRSHSTVAQRSTRTNARMRRFLRLWEACVACRSRARSGGCYSADMAKVAESVTLDEDVEEELRKLAERSGRPLDQLANSALRDYVRYEGEVGSSIERGLGDLDGGRTRTTDEVLAYLREQRLARNSG